MFAVRGKNPQGPRHNCQKSEPLTAIGAHFPMYLPSEGGNNNGLFGPFLARGRFRGVFKGVFNLN